MTFCATIGDVSGVIVMSVIITIILLFKYPRLAIWFICTILSGTLINILIKMTIERMRPYNHLPIDSGFHFQVATLMRVHYFCDFIDCGDTFNQKSGFESYFERSCINIMDKRFDLSIIFPCALSDRCGWWSDFRFNMDRFMVNGLSTV